MMRAKKPLEDIGVLVTRPAQQAEGLCRLIETQGGKAIRFPVIEILGPRNPATALSIIERLHSYDMAIFTSANAVSGALPLIQARQALPTYLILVAIGRASAKELSRYGIPADVVPDAAFNSETLLAMPQMQAVAGRRIVIFRGEGGRELLGDTLKERGARVDYAEVYRRERPAVNPGELIQRWKWGEIHVAIVTSNESLQNLFDIVGEPGQQWLRNTPLIVVSKRARQLAQELGVRQPVLLAGEASDEAVVETLLKWHQD